MLYFGNANSYSKQSENVRMGWEVISFLMLSMWDLSRELKIGIWEGKTFLLCGTSGILENLILVMMRSTESHCTDIENKRG